MNFKNLGKKNIGQLVRLRPLPQRWLNGRRLPPRDDLWRIDSVESNGVTIHNISTDHSRKLGGDNVREFRSDRPDTGPHFLLLRAQVIVDGYALRLEPIL